MAALDQDEIRRFLEEPKKDVHMLYRKLMTTYASNHCPQQGYISSFAGASAGFVCTVEQQLSCIWCGLVIDPGKENVNLIAFHLATSPKCELAHYLGRVTVSDDSNLVVGDTTSTIHSGKITVRSREHIKLDMELDYSKLSQEQIYQKYRQKIGQLAVEKIRRDVAKTDAPAVQASDFTKEICRRLTFGEHRNPITDLLAARGFYITRSNNYTVVKCVFCNYEDFVQPDLYENSEFPDEVHKAHIINGDHECEMVNVVQGTGNVPYVWSDLSWNPGVDAKVKGEVEPSKPLGLGINYFQQAYPGFAVLDRRQRSLITYPHKALKKADELAEAGYFYKGEGHEAVCFSCGVTTKKWRDDKDAWTSHAMDSPECPFVKEQKGIIFVKEVIGTVGSPKDLEDESPRTRVTVRALTPRMDSSVVQRAMLSGMNHDDVKTAVMKRIEREEPDFKYLAEIATALNEAEEAKKKVVKHTVAQPLPRIVCPPIAPAMSSPKTKREPLSPDPKGSTSEPVSEDFRGQATEYLGKLTCKVCLGAVVEVALVPCMHMGCCLSCSRAFTKCPICRKDIEGSISVKI